MKLSASTLITGAIVAAAVLVYMRKRKAASEPGKADTASTQSKGDPAAWWAYAGSWQ